MSLKTKFYLIGGIFIAYLVIFGFFTFRNQDLFGAGYRPVTGYEARLTAFLDDVTASTTINVNTTKDPAGNEIVLSNISPSSTPRVFFNLEPGTPREEIVMCTGKSTNQWTSCIRGLDFQGGTLTASSTLAKDHNAGSKIIISNVGQFYGEFVSINGSETLFGVKTFDSFPAVTNTSAVPVSSGQLATKGYVDSVGAGGFTDSNVSSTLGLQAITSGTPNCPTAAACVGINASSTASANGGFLAFATSTGRIYWDIISFLTGATRRFTSLTADSLTAVTVPGNLAIIGSPVSASDAVNKAFVDASVTSTVAYGSATGTAGMPITAGNALYISTTSTLFQTNTSAASSTFQFVGVALTAASTGGVVTYSRPGELNCSQSSLSAGYPYFLNGTAGQIGTTPGTNFARIGIATNASCLQLEEPRYTTSGTFTTALTVGATTWTTFITTGFYSREIDLYSSCGNTKVSDVGKYGGGSQYVLNNGASGALTSGFVVRAGTGTTSTISSVTPNGFVFTGSDTTGQNCTMTTGWTAKN